MAEIDASFLPPALYGSLRQPLEGGNFGERESAEELQVDHFGKLRLDVCQLIQCVADQREVAVRYGAVSDVGVKGGDFEFATALDGGTAPGVIDDQATHHAGRVTHESGVIRKARVLASCDIEVGFMEKGGYTQGMTATPV